MVTTPASCSTPENTQHRFVCPVSGLAVGFYGKGDTYDRAFTSICSSYEECRAECVGLHLCLVPGVTEIFGYSGAQA